MFILCTLCSAPLSGVHSEHASLNRVLQYLNDQSIPYEERFLLHDYGGFGSSVLVRKQQGLDSAPSGGPSGEAMGGTFVFAVPLHASFAVETALRMAGALEDRAASHTILIAFLGDEDSTLALDAAHLPHKGLRDLLSLVDMPENWVLCYFDADQTPSEIIIRHGRQGYMAPLEIVRPLPSLFGAHNIPRSFKIRYNEIYKLGLVEGPSALRLAWEEEINGIVFSGSDQHARQGPLSAEAAAALFLDYAGAIEFPVINTDRFYSVLSFPFGLVLFAGEWFILILLLIAAGGLLFLFLAYSVNRNVVLVFHLRLFVKNIWIFLIFLPLMILSIRVSSLFYYALGLILSPQGAALNYAGVFMALTLALLVYALPSPALDLFRFTRRAWFYGFSAVIFVVTGITMAAILDFSFVLIFLWAFVFAFVGASVTRPPLIFLSALMIPFFALAAFINIIQTGSSRIIELFITPHWSRPVLLLAAQTALIGLPSVLLVLRGAIIVQRSRGRGIEARPNRRYRLILLPLLIALVMGIMAVHLRLLPRPPLEMVQRDEEAGERIRVSLEDVPFLESRIITLTIESQGDPRRIDVFLESESQESLLPVYSAAVPFERRPDGRMIQFALGEDPPHPLVLEFVVPRDFMALLHVAGLYALWDPEIDSSPRPNPEAPYVFRLHSRSSL